MKGLGALKDLGAVVGGGAGPRLLVLGGPLLDILCELGAATAKKDKERKSQNERHQDKQKQQRGKV